MLCLKVEADWIHPTYMLGGVQDRWNDGGAHGLLAMVSHVRRVTPN